MAITQALHAEHAARMPASVGAIWTKWLRQEDLRLLTEHPLLVALEDGTASLELLKRLLAQHSHYSRHFTRYLCALLGQFGDARSIRALLANLREEMGVDEDGQDTHAEMFQRSLRLVGVDPNQEAALPATAQLRSSMLAYCKSADPMCGLAAMCLGAEAIVPLIYGPILHALRRFGFGPEATEFFRLHIEEDEEHAITMLRMMEEIVSEHPARGEVGVAVGSEMIRRRVEMLDAVWTSAAAPMPAALNRSHNSSDFWRVPSSLTANIPIRLSHPDVMAVSSAADHKFSGERKHRVHIVDLPSHTISMTIGHLEIGEATGAHRHNYETLIYVLQGIGSSVVGDRVVEWKAGDAFYIPPWAVHRHQNSANQECIYIACENAPLLQNLGGIALREELSEFNAV
ncbi:iron-containing redox enzyme family protein [Trinickia diaoshuihuensis]|uniref:iron-containing redox enzyme family protein n=1 Tax=Trinickia diaoshuihuensis TaxID=2292265 RepID=UPI00196735E7|nr:iron-containing redox enzyme family protein [Trinickia diaoshuihuensis]